MNRLALAYLNLGQLNNAIGTYTKLCEIQPSKSNQKALKECQEVDTKLKLAI